MMNKHGKLFTTINKQTKINTMRRKNIKESKLQRMISETVKRALNEWSDDYEGNDLDYESIKMQAEDIIYKMQQQGMPISWRSVAENMGFRLNTLNGEDLELLKDTIEEVMVNDYNTNESIKRRIRRIVSECTKKTLNEGIYDYPDGIDHLILLSENDRECHDIYWSIIQMLLKKVKKGVDLSVDILANSSIMKKYQQFVFRKFKNEQPNFDRNAPRAFREYIAERMIERINNEEFDY